MTKTEDIKRLLVSYYDGQTTEEEEETLRSYFNGDLRRRDWRTASAGRSASGTR